MRRLGYARVSTGEQADALDAQRSRLQAAGCLEVHWDIESGKEDDRDGLLQVMALVKAGGWDELVVTRADRLARHAAYGDALIAICEAHHVRIQALDGGTIETSTPQGFLMARLQTSLAEMESRMLSMRIKKQFAVYRTQGRHLRRRLPFGYAKGPDHKLIPNPKEWDQALQVLADLREMGSFSRVAYKLPSWCSWNPSTTNLQNWFVNPVIRGHVGHNLDKSSGKGWRQRWEQILYDQHPALISEGEWHELADDLRRTKNRFKGVNNSVRHGMTGLLHCHTCGHKLSRNTSNGVAWWRCRHRLCNDRGGIKEDEIFPVVIRACVEAAEQLAIAAATPPDMDPQVAAKLQDLKAMQELAERTPALRGAVQLLEDEIRGMQQRRRPAPDLGRYKRMMLDPAFFSEATAEEQRAMFQAVLYQVSVGAGGQPVLPQRRSF